MMITRKKFIFEYFVCVGINTLSVLKSDVNIAVWLFLKAAM